MFSTANDRLSKAASAIATIRGEGWMDYELDGSGELGPAIAAGHAKAEREAVAEFGFTPDSYNDELRARLAPDHPKMSHRVYALLSELEVESEEDYHDNNTYVNTGGELSSLAYLKMGDDR